MTRWKYRKAVERIVLRWWSESTDLRQKRMLMALLMWNPPRRWWFWVHESAMVALRLTRDAVIDETRQSPERDQMIADALQTERVDSRPPELRELTPDELAAQAAEALEFR